MEKFIEKQKLNRRVWDFMKEKVKYYDEKVKMKQHQIRRIKVGTEDWFDEPEFETLVLLCKKLHYYKEQRKEYSKKCKFWKSKYREISYLISLEKIPSENT